jgi:hypothetical protein
VIDGSTMGWSAAPAEVAGWMVQHLRRQGMLPQFYAAEAIRRQFGDGFVYEDDRGFTAVRDDVVREFLRAAGGAVRWDDRRRFWFVEEVLGLPETLPFPAD